MNKQHKTNHRTEELSSGIKIDTNSPHAANKRYRRRQFPWFFTMLLLSIVFLVGYLAVFDIDSGLEFKPALPGVNPSDPNLELVRAYLKENTNTGEWEEVRWWPAVANHEKYDKYIAEQIKRIEAILAIQRSAQLTIKELEADGVKIDYKPGDRSRINLSRDERSLWEAKRDIHQANFDLVQAQANLEELKRDREMKICRLKFRTQNGIGATVIFDELFCIRENEIDVVIDSSDETKQALEGIENPFRD